MGSDNQWTALGPAIVGFQTDGTNIDRGADIAGKLVGIKGACMGDVGDGVQGFGAGNFSGVAGFGGTDNGTGVFGIGGVPPDRFGGGGAGVRGVGAGAPNTSPSGPVGVFGQGGTNTPGVVGQGGDGTADGVQGYATGPFSGVAGFGGATDGSGVFGSGGGRVGPGVRGIGAGGSNTAPAGPVGVYGQGGGPTGTGVVGIGAGGSNTESPTSDGVFGEAGKGGGSAGVRGVSNQFNGTGIGGLPRVALRPSPSPARPQRASRGSLRATSSWPSVRSPSRCRTRTGPIACSTAWKAPRIGLRTSAPVTW